MALFTRVRSEPAPAQQISPLREAERVWLRGLLEGLELRVSALSDLFEAMRAAWFAADADARPDPNPLINAVGAGIGRLLVDRVGLRWIVVQDVDGTELAVTGPAGVLVFPLNLVAKRFTPDFDGTLQELYDALVLEVYRAGDQAASMR